MNIEREIQAVPETPGPSVRVGVRQPLPEKDEWPEAPAMPPRVRVVKALLCSHGPAGRVDKCHSSELGMVPHQGLRVYPFILLSVFSDGLSVGVFLRQSQRYGLGPSESSPKSLGCTRRLPVSTIAFTAAGGPHLLRSRSAYKMHQDEDTIFITFTKRFCPAILSLRAHNYTFLFPTVLRELAPPGRGSCLDWKDDLVRGWSETESQPHQNLR